MSEKTKQIDRILRYIEEMGSITPLEALRELGVMRLASRMSDIKMMGYNIEKSWVTAVNKWGEPVRYMRYTIKKGGNSMTKEEAIKTLKKEIEDTAKQMEETDYIDPYRDELYGAKRAYKMSLMLLEQVDEI